MSHQTRKRSVRGRPGTGHGLSQVREESMSMCPAIGLSAHSGMDLKKEYIRFCKLYSSEPLDIIASPLQKATEDRDREVTVVDLKGRGLRGVDCIAIGRILALDPPITALNLSDCLLLPQGFQALVDGLCKNTRIRSLELRGNNIQGTMTSNLGRLLKANHRLKSLLLEWNCLGLSNDGLQTFSDGLSLNHGLEKLDLRNNQLGPDAATALGNALRKNKTLRELDLRWNSLGLEGAKSLWESLRFNFTLQSLSLCGNFIPEEVVKCIQHCLQQQSQREAMMEEYSRRTSLLTRELQRTENDHVQELNTINSVLDSQEKEFKLALEDSHRQIEKLTEQLRAQTIRSHSYGIQIEKLQVTLDTALDKEDTLLKALEIKEKQSETVQLLLKADNDKVKGTYETKLGVTLEELEAKGKEVTALREKIKKLETEVELKGASASSSQEHLIALQNQLEQNRIQFEGRLAVEKDKWSQWKQEVETSEKREIRNLEEEIRTIQDTMLNHIKKVERGKSEAEEEIRNLKFSFLTLKTEAEEEQSALRSKLKAEQEEVLRSSSVQIAQLKDQILSLEEKLQVQTSLVRKLESENTTLVRQNENMKLQIGLLGQEMGEKDVTINKSLARARAEVRDQLDQLSKEAEANQKLRSQNLELQEEVAILTVKGNRALQEQISENEKLKTIMERQEGEMCRIKEEDMRRAALLHEAFLAYLRSTAAATGISLPTSYFMNPLLTPQVKGHRTGDGGAGDSPEVSSMSHPQ